MKQTLYYELIGGPLDGDWSAANVRPEDGDTTVVLGLVSRRGYVYRFDASIERWLFAGPFPFVPHVHNQEKR